MAQYGKGFLSVPPCSAKDRARVACGTSSFFGFSSAAVHFFAHSSFTALCSTIIITAAAAATIQQQLLSVRPSVRKNLFDAVAFKKPTSSGPHQSVG